MNLPTLPVKALLLTFLCLLAVFPKGYANLDSVKIEEALRRATDYFIQIEDPQSVSEPWWWDRAVFYLGVIESAKLLEESAYYLHAEEWSVMNNWRSGNPSNAWRHPLHADAHVAHQVYIDLYNYEPEPIRVAATYDRMMDLVNNTFWNDPRTNGNISEDNWWWIDAYYMAGPALAKSANLFEEEAFRSQLRRMYDYMKNIRDLFSEEHGLWFRDQTQLPPDRLSPNGEPVFWSRGNGWVFAGHTRVLDELPENHPDRETYLQNFLAMAPAIAALQSEDGFWRSNLLDPNHYPGPESSGTALFATGIAWGIRNGLLEEEVYAPVLRAAWDALSKHALKTDGLVGYVQRPGIDPQTAGSHETHDFGVGCFILAAVEILKLKGGPAAIYPIVGAPSRISLEQGKWTAEQVLDSSMSLIRSGNIKSVSWWADEAYLGSDEQLAVHLPAGETRIRLEIESADGEIFQNTKSITVNHSAPGFSSVEASSWQTPNIPANAIDDNLETRWSAEGMAEWLRLDFDTSTTVEGIEIAFHLGNQRQYYFAMDLYITGRSVPMRTMFYTSSGTQAGFESFHFDEPLELDAIRWIGYRNSENAWNSISSIRPITTEPAWDGNDNGLPDQWELHKLGQTGKFAADYVMPNGRSLLEHYQAGTDPLADETLPELELEQSGGSTNLILNTRAAFGPGYQNKKRVYTILKSSDLTGNSWSELEGYEAVTGDNRRIVIELETLNQNQSLFFRADIKLQSF